MSEMDTVTFFDVLYLLCLAAPCVVYCFSVFFYRKAKQNQSCAVLRNGLLFKRIAVCGMLFLNVIYTCLSMIFPIGDYIEPSAVGIGIIFSLPAVCFLGVGFFIRRNMGINFRIIGCALFVLAGFGGLGDNWVTLTSSALLCILWILVFLSCFIKKEKKGILIATICFAALSFAWGMIVNITTAIQTETSFYHLISWCISLLLSRVSMLLIVQMNQREFEEDFIERFFLPKPIAERQEEFLEEGGEITLGPTG